MPYTFILRKHNLAAIGTFRQTGVTRWPLAVAGDGGLRGPQQRVVAAVCNINQQRGCGTAAQSKF